MLAATPILLPLLLGIAVAGGALLGRSIRHCDACGPFRTVRSRRLRCRPPSSRERREVCAAGDSRRVLLPSAVASLPDRGRGQEPWAARTVLRAGTPRCA